MSNVDQWLTVTGVVAINNAVEYCNPTADQCTLINPWPSIQIALAPGDPTIETLTDSRGGSWRYDLGWNGGLLRGIRRPGNAIDEIQVDYGSSLDIHSSSSALTVTRAGTSYVYNQQTDCDGPCPQPPPFVQVLTAQGSLGYSKKYKTQYRLLHYNAQGAEPTPYDGVVLASTDDFGATTTYQYDQYLRPTQITWPEGNQDRYSYDDRANILQLTKVAKPGTGLTDIVRSVSYAATCTNRITCNLPNSVTDARGNTLTFTYDSVHGGVLTKTGPAVNGVTPQTRFEYAQRYAWLKNSSGSYNQAASPVWVLVRERFCRTTNPSGSSCVGGASDEVVTDYDYGPNSGPNNLLVRGIAVTADGQTRRTCYGYDQLGRRITETKPNANLSACP